MSLGELYQLERIRFGCAAHSLQLSVNHAVRQDPSAEEFVQKCGAIVASIRNSTAYTEELFNGAGLHLESHNATRWNSQLRIMRKLVTTLSSHPGLIETLHPCKKVKLYKCELRLATDLIELLSPVEEATELLQEMPETAGLLLPAWRNIEDSVRFEAWRRAVPRADKSLDARSVLCEHHFDEQYIDRCFTHVIKREIVEIPRERPLLKADAVPTVFFNVPAYLSKKAPKKRTSRTSTCGLPTKIRREEPSVSCTFLYFPLLVQNPSRIFEEWNRTQSMNKRFY
ncbi:hypothetical protein HPB51_024780 [Rhipicephalus microplus]|uniref:THAP-type domain-containing protein n=1 Tax=Rhipicephalus microplus TaxID=6941 RepID=A0A9J6D7T7_RHIMP|nr:hypothetical protein HPB51_024780 [Rhipicephalus microplus]